MREPLETSELLAFASIVQAKSLSRAAQELRVPRATLSRRLSRLEQRLGTRLLRRTTRSLALTDAGAAFYRHARIVLDAVSEAENSVQHGDDSVRGDLRVSLPPIRDAAFFERLIEFAREHPALRLQVHFTSRHVDLRREGYDVALRGTTDLEPGLVARTLWKDRTIGVASPSYLERHGVPRTRKDLRDHRLLMAFARGELPQTHWQVSGTMMHLSGAFFSNEIELLRQAAVSGLGIAFLPQRFLHAYLASGELVQVLPGVLEAPNRLSIVYPEREFVPTQVRAFADALASWVPMLDAQASTPPKARKKRASKR